MNKSSQRGNIALILLFTVLLVGVAAGAYFYGKGGLTLPTKQPASSGAQVSPTPTVSETYSWISEKFISSKKWRIPLKSFKLYYPKSWQLTQKSFSEGDTDELIITLSKGTNSLEIGQISAEVGICDYSGKNTPENDTIHFSTEFIEIKKNDLTWRLASQKSQPEAYEVCELDSEGHFGGATRIGFITIKMSNKESFSEAKEILNKIEILNE